MSIKNAYFYKIEKYSMFKFYFKGSKGSFYFIRKKWNNKHKRVLKYQ